MSQQTQSLCLSPEQAAFLAGFLIKKLRHEFETTCRVLKAVPAGQESYRPHENSRTALELAWHLANVDVWFLGAFLSGNFDMDDDSMPDEVSKVSDIADWYEDVFPAKLDKVSTLSPEFWAAPLPFFGKFNHSPAAYLEIMLLHSVHHRGQLTAYLRPMGAKVPNIYGGSYDEPSEEIE
ncbi:MAG TPA: DinB family protein [Verrucomicrobiae bacterium]|nr:DinB family protein [Verrucomicrobiae bacterium]